MANVKNAKKKTIQIRKVTLNNIKPKQTAKNAIKNTDKSDVDCLLSMELIDFTYAEYLRDSGMLGRNRVALGMGHFNLEEPGMEYMLEYLDEAIGEHIPAWFKQSGDNYEYMTKDCCHDH